MRSDGGDPAEELWDDPADGASELVAARLSATGVAVVDDRLVIAGISGLEGLPLPDPIGA